MNKWYLMETQNANSVREYSEVIYTDSLLQAKRLATKAQTFEGTVLQIGKSLGFGDVVEDIVAIKENGKWRDVE